MIFSFCFSRTATGGLSLSLSFWKQIHHSLGELISHYYTMTKISGQRIKISFDRVLHSHNLIHLTIVNLREWRVKYRVSENLMNFLSRGQGRRSPDVKNYQPSLYQIRANQSKLCRRVVQVPAMPTSLNSAFW